MALRYRAVFRQRKLALGSKDVYFLGKTPLDGKIYKCTEVAGKLSKVEYCYIQTIRSNYIY